MEVRVRFAPSPTGYLHVGGLRTALYNYLFAKHHGGKCILRIEDTDRTRFVENAQENLIESLAWAGITFDEGPDKGGQFGPYIQSERFDLYSKYAEELLEKGLAYKAFDTPEEIEAMRERMQADGQTAKYDRNIGRNSLTLSSEECNSLISAGMPFTVRLKVPDNTDVVFHDIIRGEVCVNTKEVDDQVLLKSDGFPTYHLANVVDDHSMKITHVIRGEEWLPSTPKHALLYQAFGWECPQFAHLPLLLNKDKSKLSKRQGSVAVEDFRAKGYLRDAFVNFVALLGWNPTGDREIYRIEELIEFFNLEKVNKSGAVFDTQKLDWMNQQYLKLTDPAELIPRLKDALAAKGISDAADKLLTDAIILFRERVTFVEDIPETADYLFGEIASYDEEYYAKHKKENTLDLLSALLSKLKTVDDYSHDPLHEAVKGFCDEVGIKLKEIIHAVRLAVTGKATGAGMFETMAALGKSVCEQRIETFVELFKNK